MLVPSQNRAAASLRMLLTQPWLNGAGISWITTRRGLLLASGARSITSRSDAAITVQSALGAALTISAGASGECWARPAAMLAEACGRAGVAVRSRANGSRWRIQIPSSLRAQRSNPVPMRQTP